MKIRPEILDHWPEVSAHFPAGFDIEATERLRGAFTRAREIKNAETLLRLALACRGNPQPRDQGEGDRTLVFSLEVSGFSQCFQEPFRHFSVFWAVEIATEFLFVRMAVASPCSSFPSHLPAVTAVKWLCKDEPWLGTERTTP